MNEKWTTEKVNKLMMKKLVTGDTYSFPSVPLEDACHMAVNGIIRERRDDCTHGQIGEQEQVKRGRPMIVTEVDHENKSFTVDVVDERKKR